MVVERLEVPVNGHASSRDGSSCRSGDVSPRSAGGTPNPTIETPSYTFTLPNITCQTPKEFQQFLEKELIETSTMKALQQSGHLNWWVSPSTSSGCTTHASSSSQQPQLDRLYPLSTSGDGNCLLHAASLGMWGFHDRLLILRKALHDLLTNGSRRHALWRRWRFQQSLANQEIGLKFDEDEWKREWESLVHLASPEPRSKYRARKRMSSNNHRTSTTDAVAESSSDVNGNDTTTNGEPVPKEDEFEPVDEDSPMTYESLEEIHVFTLAHVLKRPIIVIADTVLRGAAGDPLAPIPFGGIYLPIECSPKDTHRSPLVLCYDAAHFSALVTMQPAPSDTMKHSAVIPITNSWHELLTVHFAADPGPDFTWWSDEADTRLADRARWSDEHKLALIARYTDLVKIQCPSSIVPKSRTLPAVSAVSSTPTTDNGSSHNTRHLQSPLHRAMRSLNRRSSSLRRGGARNDNDQYDDYDTSKWSDSLKRIFHRGHSKSVKSESRHAAVPTSASENGFASISIKIQLAKLRRCFSKPSTSVNPLPPSDIRLEDVHSHGTIVAARLHTDTHHQYMNDMVNCYLASARKRYQLAKEKTSGHSKSTSYSGTSSTSSKPSSSLVDHNLVKQSASADYSDGVVVKRLNGDSSTQPHHATSTSQRNGHDTGAVNGGAGVVASSSVDSDTRRARCISRSLSATSMNFTCMNGPCTQPSSHATNFLCVDCFHSQREMMASFSPAVSALATGAVVNGASGGHHQITTTTSPHRSPVKQHRRNESIVGGQSITNNSNNDQSVNHNGNHELSNGERLHDRIVMMDDCYDWQQHFDINHNPDSTNGDCSTTPHTTTVMVRSSHRVEPLRIGVNAVTNPNGVTHYYLPSPVTCHEKSLAMADVTSHVVTQYCRSPHCANYSNGHRALCQTCTKRQESVGN